MAYVALALAAITLAELWLDISPITIDRPWLTVDGVPGVLYSALLGVTLAALVIALSRRSATHFAWGRRLQEEFRPVAADLSLSQIGVLAFCSGLAEELIFRGILQQFVGLWAQAALFGLVHQMRGPSRWIWVTWAAAVGLALGALFQLTGSLLGPLLAHMLINHQNLIYLKHQRAPAPVTGLGGLMKRSGNQT